MTELRTVPADTTMPGSPMIARLDSAVAEVFENMLGMTCCPVDPEIRFVANLSVTISFTGLIEGRCRICLSLPAARMVMEALLGEAPESGESMVEDAAGELCNMIVGSWKSHLPPLQASALLSLPVASHEVSCECALDDCSAPPLKRLYSFNGNLLAMALRVQEC
jgi:chemotaxis protein CheX